MRENTNTKTCSDCRRVKSINEFYLNKNSHDGYCNRCKSCSKVYCSDWRKSNPEKVSESKRHLAQDLKREVLTHYGNGWCACVHCGFDNMDALSIDHIDGNGIEHRRSLGLSTGRKFYAWCKRNGYPEGYQTLCMNCQFIKRVKNKEDIPRRMK